MTAIIDRLQVRDNAMMRAVAAVEAEARTDALRYIQMDHRAVKREARRYLRSPSCFTNELNRYFKPMSEALESIERRLAFRSSWERTNPITLRGGRLYARIELRREREEARREKEAA
jgi:hypothetical protein